MLSNRSSFSDSSRDVAMATNFVAKLWQKYLPPALIALAFRNGMGYRYLNVRINSVHDASIISCEHFVKFGPVTPEMTGLICVPMYLYWAKIDLSPAFVVLPFRNAREYCYADGRINSSNDEATSDINLMIGNRYLHSSRETTVYNRRRSALGLVYLCSLSGSTVIFCYYLLGGDTVAPSRLYARLCHAFLVLYVTVNKTKFRMHNESFIHNDLTTIIKPTSAI